VIASDSALGGGTGAGAGKNAVENNMLHAKNVLDMHKELEEAKWNGEDSLPIYGKYAEISKKNR